MSEWNKEPDHIEFEASGLEALILRSHNLGHLCGYIAVPKNHVLFGLEGGEIPGEIQSHRGWTYASDINPATGETEDDKWWIGFDCCHSGDLVPAMHEAFRGMPLLHSSMQAVYRNVPYVREMINAAAVDVVTYMGPNVAIFRA